MKIAILTDTHWGAKKGSKHLHDYFELFYKNVFFPALEEHGVQTVVHMGDAFDSRKSIDYQSLQWTKEVVLDPLLKYNVHMVVGNHDCYYKNTNFVNSPELLLKEYSNIKKYSSPQTVNIHGLDIALIPWICSENYDETLKLIENTPAKIAMGHLELNGFSPYLGHIMGDGMDPKIFSKFARVYSGHFHTRSNDTRIFYLGNPYQMYWNDVNDTRGFHILDTESLELIVINNPYNLFSIIYYEDSPHQLLDPSDYKDKIVKVVVRKKTSQKSFEKFIDKLYSSGVNDLKIIENFQIEEGESFDILEDENTLSILNRYVDESKSDFNKTTIKEILQLVYKKSCEVE